MTALTSVAAIKFATQATAATDWGAEPELQWLPLSSLKIDHSYQRDILAAGRGTIRRIVEGFRWAKFGQLVVSRRANGACVILDGQHRAVACAVLGIAEVPCQVLSGLAIEEEADAFAAINGNVTRPSPLQIFNARFASGDRQASALRAIFDAAGVEVPRHAMICDRPGLCTAIGTLESCHKTYGAEILTRALKLVVDTGGGNAGLLKPTVIGGLCDVLKANKRFIERPGDLKAALEAASIAKLYAKAQRVQSLDGGTMRAHFAAAVVKALGITLGKAV